MEERVEVVIMTVSRDFETCSRHVERNIHAQMRAVKAATGAVCKWEVLSGFAMVALARSVLLNTCIVKYPHAHTFVFWDDDQIIFGDDGLERLLSHRADVVGTLVVSKVREVRLQTRLRSEGRTLPLSFDLAGGGGANGLIELNPMADDATNARRELTGFGLIAFSRDTVEAIIRHYMLEPVFLNDDSIVHVFFELIADLAGRRSVFGEDFGFCIKAATAGRKVYIDPRVIVGHLGPYFYTLPDIGRVENLSVKTFPATFSLVAGEDENNDLEVGQ